MKKFMFTIMTIVVLLLAIIMTFETKANNDVVVEYDKYYTTYIIENGDTLSDICCDLYYSTTDNQVAWDSYKDLMDEVIKINQMTKYDRICAGDQLTLVYVKVK